MHRKHFFSIYFIHTKWNRYTHRHWKTEFEHKKTRNTPKTKLNTSKRTLFCFFLVSAYARLICGFIRGRFVSVQFLLHSLCVCANCNLRFEQCNICCHTVIFMEEVNVPESRLFSIQTKHLHIHTYRLHTHTTIKAEQFLVVLWCTVHSAL